jgi:DNA (cytosine-5)-methyltransferase 1
VEVLGINERKRYFVDLFAGCGGLSLGLERAGFVPALVNELNDDAMETYLMNRDEEYPLLREKYSIGDVKELVNNELLFDTISSNMLLDYKISISEGDLDLVVGGPPCQGYSGIGHRRSYSVEKKEVPSNHLYLDMVTLIDKFRPKMFLFENVKGILSGKWTSDGVKGEIWSDVLAAFGGIGGYTMRWKLVYAKNYGVPQNRPRVLLVGVRDDILRTKDIPADALESGFIPRPTNDYPNLIEVLGDLIDDEFLSCEKTATYPKDPDNERNKKLRMKRDGSLTRRGDILEEHEYSKHSDDVRSKFRHMIGNNGKIPDNYVTKKFSQKLLPERWDSRGPSITVTSMPDDYVHFMQPRILTVREWARLQTFPDWYRFSGKRTTGGLRRAGNPLKDIYHRELPKYTQIGNAVPVDLAETIGKNLMRILEENNA